MAARDIIAIFVVVMFATGLGLFLMRFTGDLLVDAMLANNSDFNQSEASRGALESVKEDVTAKFDYLFLMFFFGMIIVMLIVSWLFGAEPVFIFLFIIVMILALILAPIFANIWTSVSTHASFGTTITQFPITNHILQNLPIYVTLVGLLSIALMFGKKNFERI